MKKQLTLFVFAIAILLVALIAYDQHQKSPEVTGKAKIEKYFKKTLKDPASLVIYSETAETGSGSTVKWVVDYGAKNSFGAMTRETCTFETSDYSFYVNGEFVNIRDLE